MWFPFIEDEENINNYMSNYSSWNIIDLFDYLKNYYFDNAQIEPETYGAKYDGPDPEDYPTEATDIKQTKAYVTSWRLKYAIKVNDVWYWRDNVVDSDGNHTYIVSKFKDLIYIWRAKEVRLTEKYGEFAKHYIDPPRNNYVISAGAWENILKERYAEFKFLASFDYDYITKKRTYVKTIEEAAAKLWKTIDVYKHDKIDPLTKLFDALRSEYDPISNYDKVSDSYTKFVGSEVDKVIPDGEDITEFEKGGEQYNHEKTSYDSSTPNLVDSNILVGDSQTGVAYKDTTTHKFDDRIDIHHRRYGYDADNNADERKDIYHEETKGNIGVTTSQQMIMSQFEVERFDRIEHYVVSDFVHTSLIR